MRDPVLLLIAAVMLAVFAADVCAQRNPPMAEQQRDADELKRSNAGLCEKGDPTRRSQQVKKAEPFKNIDVARAYLNAAVGTLLRDKSPAEAAPAASGDGTEEPCRN